MWPEFRYTTVDHSMTPSEMVRKSSAISIDLWNFIFQNGLSMVSVDDVSLKLWLPWTKYLPYSSSPYVLFSFKKLRPTFGLANIDCLSSLAFLWGSLRKWEICRLNYFKNDCLPFIVEYKWCRVNEVKRHLEVEKQLYRVRGNISVFVVEDRVKQANEAVYEIK